VIKDFGQGRDVIDLSGLAETGHDLDFLSAEGASFDGIAGQLRWFQQDRPGAARDTTIVAGDLDGDRRADFQIELSGKISLTEGDFLL
jgi:hypothetical protein